jgi:hypothetical protein
VTGVQVYADADELERALGCEIHECRDTAILLDGAAAP